MPVTCPIFERAIGQIVRLVLACVAIGAISGPAFALPPAGTCFTVRAPASGDRVPWSVDCRGKPAGYENAALWLRLPERSLSDGDVALLVHLTRFDRLKVLFTFAGGGSEIQTVHRGAFGDHWHIGGQISFQPRPRSEPLTAIWLRIDRLQRYELLRIRVVRVSVVSRQFELCAALIGAAISLLAVTALHSFAMAVAVRQRLFLWHGMWAAMMVCWGLVWSQCVLFVWPRIAGTTSSQLMTVMACVAVMFATRSAVIVLQNVLPLGVRRALSCASSGMLVLGGWAAVPGSHLGMIGNGLATLILAILAAIGGGLVIGYRQRAPGARALLVAWIVPMLVLATTQVIDFDTSLFGGGEQIALLFGSAFQAICLSALETRRLRGLRLERDAAIASEMALAEVAERDALTGLLNRRGFVRRCEQAFGDLRQEPFGLLLIDVDRFKTINDRYGHEAGDAVLVVLSDCLRALERRHACLAGRLGGEEFLLGVSGMPLRQLRQFADRVREDLRASKGEAGSCHPEVTVSIGVAVGAGSGPFAELYGQADRALYKAKAMGRNRVVFEDDADTGMDQRRERPDVFPSSCGRA